MRYGKARGGRVPPEDWTVERPFDSSDYLDGEPPRYADDAPKAQEASMNRVELAVEESLRDTAASRARWRKWELAHGKGMAVGSRRAITHPETGKPLGHISKHQDQGSPYYRTTDVRGKKVVNMSFNAETALHELENHAKGADKSAAASSGDGPGRPGHFGGAEQHYGKHVAMKDADYSGTIVGHDGSEHYRVKIDRGRGENPALAGPQRTTRVHHSNLRFTSGKGADKSAASAGEIKAEHVQAVLPGAHLRKTKEGHEVGGFSMPPVQARRKLEAAGFAVKDVWGATVITGRKRKTVEAAVAGAVQEVLEPSRTTEAAEVGKPGTNWKQVTPEAKHKLRGILKHYKGMAHPFAACVRDNTKRFGKDRAERICAVVKDLNERTTKWRNGGDKKVSEAQMDEALGLLWEAIAPEPGEDGVELVEAALVAQLEPVTRALVEAQRP